MDTNSTTTSTYSSSSSPSRTAMNNLRVCLESFPQQSMMPSSTSTDFGGLTQLEYLFDTTFYKTIRFDLNGRSYRRDFLLYQARCNYKRRLRVQNLIMEILDNETFHYTFDIILDNNDDDQLTTAPPKLLQFHSIATVNNRNGKIIRIKPMTGSAYVELFEYNINYVIDEQQQQQQQQQQQNKNKNKALQASTTSTLLTKKAAAVLTSEQQRQLQQQPLLMNTQKKRRRKQQQRKSSGIIRRVSGLFSSHCRSKVFATTE
jgi:hypothetical protein